MAMFRRKEYKYHVSFYVQEGGLGHIVVDRNKKIYSETDFDGLTELINKRFNTDVVILSITRLGA